MPSIHYIKKPSGYSHEAAGLVIKPIVYQPTSKGVKTLCAHYCAKYGIDLRSIDLREPIPDEDYIDLAQSFSYLAQNPSLLNVEEGKSRGLILSHGEHHAVPLLIINRGGERSIVCFDSTSGASIKAYYRMADILTGYQFYLNEGTRQADKTSCITDAVCILKEALLIDHLMDLINAKVYKSHPALNPTRFYAHAAPNNFKLFNMPEQLLVTAQLPTYIKDADTEIILRGGKTLKNYRSQYCITLSLFKGVDRVVKNINSYLYLKSVEHKHILDALEAKNNSIDALSLSPGLSPRITE